MSEVATNADTGPQKDDAKHDGAPIKSGLSIQQILEGMTNEFNKTGPKKQNDSVKRLSKTEPPMQKLEKSPIKIIEDNSKTSKTTNVQDCLHNVEDDIKIIRENISDKTSDNMKKPDESAPKQESLNKKDRARIVLTFRTIDENTDHGKKTKISSLPSNLSLVPDEFANCDEIGGVSVKIEDFDESCKDSNKSDTEENQTVENANSSTTDNVDVREENALENCKKTNQQQEESHQETSEVTPESNHASHNNSDISTDKSFEELESTMPNTRKTRRKRLKESSDEAGLKRSARHLSKELKSTVLESAMARKEKFNYTEENSRRRYSKPGRPKKPTPEKKDNTKDIPKLTPIDPSKFMTDKKSLPELCPLNSIKNIMPTNTINLSDSQKRNKYEGMPKLTPIIKSTEIVKSKSIESIDAISSMNNALKKLDEIFLKPIPAKSKPEKVWPPSPTKKLMKGNNSKESSSSSNGSEISQENGSSEGCSPNKKIRRNMIPSPSTAEGIASKPESTAILTKKHNKIVNRRQDMQCLCEVRSQLFVTITSADSPLYCTALDSNDNRIVGCCNLVDHDDVAMRRPSARIPYIILCRMHKERLIRHNCCPTCGLFCSQGKFVHCSNGHQYHRDCEMYYDDKPLCPHCGSYGRSYDVIITMSGKRKPIHIPSQKQIPKEPQAKISLPGIGDNEKLAEQQTVLKKSTEPLIDPNLVRIPKPISLEKMERYTISSLLSAVKNDDVQKLVNVLANGFNANHSFRDQSQRTSLHIAANKGSLICVHILIQAGAQHNALDKNQLSPLMLAAGNGHVEVIKYLMRVGADATFKGEDGMTALHIAAKSGHLDACKAILSECGDRRTLVDLVDDGGWTSLIWACEFRHAEIAKFLLDNRCDPLIRDSEQNIALHWSAFSGSSEITEMLLSLGCDVNAANVHGDTPLHIAARQDQYAVSVLLLSRGAKIREKNIMGDTPLECCLVPGDTKNALELNLTLNPSTLLEKTVRILTNDISRGKETNPIQCVNGLDLEDKPTDFVYVTENCYTSKINVDRTITSLQSCRCENQCNTDKCICGKISLRCWYDDEKYEGKLVPEFNYADPPMLFECNAACDCNKITCNNRVVQHGISQRFQLFRTSGKGWGLRTLRLIPKGAYVCEYVGEVISDSEADLREDDSYLFDLDNRDGETYCIDARRYGNIARFINHSCAPNLLPVRVFIDHQDLHFPRIAFFANRDIDADEELGFDYGEKFWIVKCKSFTCTCGAENCRYSDKTIQITLDNYRKRIQQEEILASQVSTTQKL